MRLRRELDNGGEERGLARLVLRVKERQQRLTNEFRKGGGWGKVKDAKGGEEVAARGDLKLVARLRQVDDRKGQLVQARLGAVNHFGMALFTISLWQIVRTLVEIQPLTTFAWAPATARHLAIMARDTSNANAGALVLAGLCGGLSLLSDGSRRLGGMLLSLCLRFCGGSGHF